METTDTPIRIPLDLVESTMLCAIGHDAPRLILAVQFKTGAIYHYAGVEQFVFNELREALSIGQYFNANIRGKYQGQRMTGSCPACGAQHGWIGDPCTDCGTADYQADAPRTPKSAPRGSRNNSNASTSSDAREC